MEQLKKKTAWLSERNLLLLLLFFFIGFFNMVSKKYTSMMLGVFLVPWAIGMFYYSVRNREIKKSPIFVVICCSIIPYFISAVMNNGINFGWIYSTGMLYVCWFFMLFVSQRTSPRQLSNQLFGVGCLFVICYLPLAFLGVVSVFIQQPIEIPLLDGIIGVGPTNDAANLLFIAANPNTAGRYLACNVLFCIYAIMRLRKLGARFFFGIALYINVVALVHTQSRTCYIALALAIGLLLFRVAYLHIPWKKWRVCLGAVACAAGIGIVLPLLNGIFVMDVSIAYAIAPKPISAVQAALQPEMDIFPGPVENMAVTRMSNENNTFMGSTANRNMAFPAMVQLSQTSEKKSIATPAEKKDGQFDVLSTGRGNIWKSAVQYLLNHPQKLLFGMGPGNIMKQIDQDYPGIEHLVTLHSSFLESLARYGILYLLCIFVFLALMIRPVYRILVAPSKEETKGMFMLSVFICMLFAMSLPERMLFESSNVFNFLFYFMCGQVLFMAKGNEPLQKSGTNGEQHLQA